MKIKVCGMRESANISEVLALHPDFMGFIFSSKSPRYVGEDLDEDLLLSFPKTTKKVGVFVNSNLDSILRNVKKYKLDAVQLHGDESPAECLSLQNKGVSVIKVFSVGSSFDFNRLNNYKPVCDYFLFDTKGENPGGNGVAFDWQILEKYDHEKPYFLSGGIGLEDLEKIQNLPASILPYALDLNSRFEMAPGLKDVEKLRTFMNELNPVLKNA